ncbi:hypothetical protein CEUSTIGMA_g6965.t1 [Chlamydomonas eustigma]|uniref:Methyltransferase type 11 domain-containing protein n=1 Tax=Chlamydomonas eustigma TaxID=1157962 RepID=A0A250X8X4_9CHLO|nr:hypothetical protein CEUSTIGMA_g6965.t1 [Chlamydomonas eustigma]|eukprot:GAX79524.1 hypothetical protein CEUSTIGMA_g6965.t1 [Chlamydomonas eustigma]
MIPGHVHAEAKATSGVQEQYDKFAPTYDVLDGGQAPELFGFDQLRSQLIGEVSGRALEVAVGTGLNLPLYRWKRTAVYGASFENVGVEDLTAIDISQGMLTEAVARVKGSPLLEDKPITLKQANATNLPFADESFDSIVDTFSLCVIEDPTAALREMARVLRPTGTAFLLEHSRSDNRLLAAYQDLTSSAVASSSKGCVWNQDVEYMLKEAGLTPKYLSRHVAGTVVLIKVVKTA